MWKSLINASLLILFALFIGSCSDDKIVSKNNMPPELSSYIAAHFPNHEVLQVSKDSNPIQTQYKVTLSDNISLEFNHKNEIIEINASQALPKSVISENINQYIQSNFPQSAITDWEKENNHQQIKLDNNLDLIFDLEGNFIRIDD